MWKIKTILPPLGISFVLLNTAIGIWANFFTGGKSGMSNVLVFVGILLIINYRNLLNWRFPVWNRYFTSLLLYEFLCIFYFYISPIEQDIRLLYFHLAVIAFMVALATRKNIDEDALLSCFFSLSLFATLCGLWAIYSGLMERAFLAGENMDSLSESQGSVLELFTVSSAGYYCFVGSLLLFKKKKIALRLLALLAIFFSILLIVLCTKRNLFVKIAFASLVFLYNQNKLRHLLTLRNVLLTVVAVAVLYYLISLSEGGMLALQDMVDNTFSGIHDMITGEQTDKSGSASARAIQRKEGLDLIFNEMSWWNYLLGVGYMWKWLDVPLVQAFCDMGVIGLYFFVSLCILRPLKAIIKNRQSSMVVLMGLLLTAHLTQCMSSGHPYIFQYYIGPVFLFWALKRNSSMCVIILKKI